jgi:hypothetical protein
MTLVFDFDFDASGEFLARARDRVEFLLIAA